MQNGSFYCILHCNLFVRMTSTKMPSSIMICLSKKSFKIKLNLMETSLTVLDVWALFNINVVFRNRVISLTWVNWYLSIGWWFVVKNQGPLIKYWMGHYAWESLCSFWAKFGRDLIKFYLIWEMPTRLHMSSIQFHLKTSTKSIINQESHSIIHLINYLQIRAIRAVWCLHSYLRSNSHIKLQGSNNFNWNVDKIVLATIHFMISNWFQVPTY